MQYPEDFSARVRVAFPDGRMDRWLRDGHENLLRKLGEETTEFSADRVISALEGGGSDALLAEAKQSKQIEGLLAECRELWRQEREGGSRSRT